MDFLAIMGAIPKYHYSYIYDIGQMPELVARVGIKPFIEIAEKYHQEANRLIKFILGEGYGITEKGVQVRVEYRGSLVKHIRSAKELIEFADTISQTLKILHYERGVSETIYHEAVGELVEKYGIANLPSIAGIAMAETGGDLFGLQRIWCQDGWGKSKDQMNIEPLLGNRLAREFGLEWLANLCETVTSWRIVDKNLEGLKESFGDEPKFLLKKLGEAQQLAQIEVEYT